MWQTCAPSKPETFSRPKEVFAHGRLKCSVVCVLDYYGVSSQRGALLGEVKNVLLVCGGNQY